MTLDFDEQAQLPVKFRVKWADGKIDDFEIPRLEMSDYAPWLDEVTKSTREKDYKSIPANMQPVDRWRVTRSIENTMATFDDLRPLIGRPEGADRVLRLSMKLAGLDDELIDKLVGRPSSKTKDGVVPGVKGVMGVNRKLELATVVSAMFQAAPLPEEFNPGGKEGKRKNSLEPASTNAGGSSKEGEKQS